MVSTRRVGANAICGQSATPNDQPVRVPSRGHGGAPGEALLQRGAARRPYTGPANVLIIVATEAESFPCTDPGGKVAVDVMEQYYPRSRGGLGKQGQTHTPFFGASLMEPVLLSLSPAKIVAPHPKESVLAVEMWFALSKRRRRNYRNRERVTPLR